MSTELTTKPNLDIEDTVSERVANEVGKRFVMVRNGEILANGCLFPNGKAVLMWVTYNNVTTWDSREEMMECHNQYFITHFYWID